MPRTEVRRRGRRLAAVALAAATVGACAPGCGAGRPADDRASAAPRADATEPSAPANPTTDTVPVGFGVVVRTPVVTDAGIVPPRWRLPLEQRPLPGTRVVLVDVANNVLFDTSTDADGIAHFASADLAAADRVVVVASHQGAADVRVVDCPDGRCSGGGAIWAWAADAATLTQGTVVVPVESAVAGAFSISAEVHSALDNASQLGFAPLPPLDLRWRSGSDTACGTSCYSGGRPRRAVYVLSVPSDTDEFDRDILRHELGHYLEDAMGVPDVPGGYHDGTPLAPAHAWSEGGCTWLAIALDGDPVYVDTGLTGGGWYDYAVPATWAPVPRLDGRVSEDFVAELLWELTVAHGEPAVAAAWRAVGSGSDRGGNGPDLVDALDRLACTDASLAPGLVDAASRRGWGWTPPVSCDGAEFPSDAAPAAPAHSPITPLRIHLSRTTDTLTVDVQLRARARAASVSVFAGLPSEETLLDALSMPDASVAAGGGRWSVAVPGSASALPLSVRVDAELDGGARYHMSASIEPDGIVPFDVPPDDTRTEKLGDDLVVRVAGDEAGR